jgi:predicted nucleotidyltransferase
MKLWVNLIQEAFYMQETLETLDKTPGAKAKPAPRQKSCAPFVDKIPFITSLLLESVDKAAIKKIILFGSYAYGKPNKQSDLDICVIVPNRRKSRSIYLRMAMALFEHKIMPVDLLVYKEKYFNAGVEKNERGIESVIKTKGKVLYG